MLLFLLLRYTLCVLLPWHERQLLHNNRVTFYRNVFRKKVSECVCGRSASMVNGRLRIYLLSSVFVFVDDFTDYIYDKDFS